MTIIDRLAAAHRVLTREIRRERTRPNPDPERLDRLARQRDATKEGLMRHLGPGELRRRFRAVLRRLRRLFG